MGEGKLGRLESVDLRQVWNSESSDFTPWLAEPDNIALLGETIGIELEVEGQEQSVGPYKADIRCRDTSTGHVVVIENQLEMTDHTHLGQLLTYGAGLKAATIVWVAAGFTEEHRAAIDWLNDNTTDELRFFGLEVELWRIGESPAAPKFNVACRPNEWSKTVVRSDLTETQQLHIEYWTAFAQHLAEHGSPLRPAKPQPTGWVNFAIGRSWCNLSAYLSTWYGRVAVVLWLGSDDAKAHFNLLLEQREEIESELGMRPEWREKPGQKSCEIRVGRGDVNPMDRKQWPDLHEWTREALEAFDRVFRPRVKALDASEWVPQAAAEGEEV